MMPSHYKQRIGKAGEDFAVKLLQGKGYEIIERNVRIHRGELDIVVRDGKTLVFVEVKTGTSDRFGDPASWVNVKKQKQIGKTALAYLHENGLESEVCRFDVISVTKQKGSLAARHIESAFSFDPNLMEDFF